MVPWQKKGIFWRKQKMQDSQIADCEQRIRVSLPMSRLRKACRTFLSKENIEANWIHTFSDHLKPFAQ